MTYIWQQKNWPNFTYADNIIPANQLYHYAQSTGRISNQLNNIPEAHRLDACIDLMVGETTSCLVFLPPLQRQQKSGSNSAPLI